MKLVQGGHFVSTPSRGGHHLQNRYLGKWHLISVKLGTSESQSRMQPQCFFFFDGEYSSQQLVYCGALDTAIIHGSVISLYRWNATYIYGHDRNNEMNQEFTISEALPAPTLMKLCADLNPVSMSCSRKNLTKVSRSFVLERNWQKPS